MTTRIGCTALTLLLLASLPVMAADDEEKNLTGSVEVLYRNVNQNGSTDKFNEDYDGLSSGARLDNLSLNWTDSGSELIEYARLDAYGLGGDPFERITGRLGRQDTYDLKIDYFRQDYIYNLFELVSNEDGAVWDATRRNTSIDLTIHANEKIDVFFDYREGDRSGSSLFMKDIQRNLFRFETPLDHELTSYSAGVRVQAGPADIIFRQTRRNYDNIFHNETEGDLGLELGPSQLFMYDWRQVERGRADWTEVKVNTSLGRRVHLSVAFMGTLVGDDELTSDVEVEQLGIDFGGSGYGGSCSTSGTTCGSDADCPASETCVPDLGVSNAVLEGDTQVIDADVTVSIVNPLTLHLRYRSMDRDFDGRALRDLDGDGTFEDENDDGEDVTITVHDYEIKTTSAVLEYRPNSKIGVRGGVRMLDRELIRSGFSEPPRVPGEPDGFRDTNFKSDDDKTVLFGVALRPVDWFRFNADYEDGDVELPFTANSLLESEHTRVRATFTPQPDMRVALSWLDFQNENTSVDFRQLRASDPNDPPPSPDTFGSMVDGQSWSVVFTHNANDRLDYDLRYAEQEIDTRTAITIDASFNNPQPALSIYENDNQQFRGRVQYRWADAWRAYLQYWLAESDGTNNISGGFSNVQPIDQELTTAEFGLYYTFDSGIFLGATIADFDYEDGGAVGTSLAGVLDYDGQIFTLRGGLTF